MPYNVEAHASSGIYLAMPMMYIENGPCMHRSRKFCQGVQLNFDNVFFLVDEGREDPNTTKRGSS